MFSGTLRYNHKTGVMILNPPPPPGYSMSPASDAYSAQQLGPPRWSALAVTAFVLSIIGFLGVTAILGIIFAVAGIAVTSGGRRRGLGLAISAIPISLVTGGLGAVVAYVGYTSIHMYKTTEGLVPVLSSSSEKAADGAESILALSSASFRANVEKSQLEQWLLDINRKHGSLTKFEANTETGILTANAAGNAVFNVRGKFTNGPALMRVTFSSDSLLDYRIDDIEVDGLSPRSPPDVPRKD